MGGLKKIYIKQIKCKYPFCAASYVRLFSRWQYYILLMSYYTHFIHTIYLLKWFENNYTPCYGLSLMEKYIVNFFTVQI